MEPASSETKGKGPGGLGSIAFALLGVCLVVISVDRLIDAWQAGQMLRVALYAVVSIAATVGAVYYMLHGGRA